MVELLKTRASHPEMRALGKRIELSQEDEIKMMQGGSRRAVRWRPNGTRITANT